MIKPILHIDDLTFQSVIALAFMLVWIVGGFLSYLVLDGTLYAIGGNTWTGSHAVYILSLHYRWFPYCFVAICVLLTAFWTWHFFG